MLVNRNFFCRLCKSPILKKNLHIFKNVPSSAQNFPELRKLNYDKGINLIICQCSTCGVVQLLNKPVSYYKEVIRATSFSKEMQNFRKSQFKQIIKKYKLKNKKIIEIGSGHGEHLSIFNNFQVKAYGMEFSKKGIYKSRLKNLNVLQGYIDKKKYKIKNGPYDAFLILSFLEHMPNLNTVLSAIYQNLKNDGIGLIEVPNFDLILKKKLFAEFVRDHLFYFTKETLIRACNINGFAVTNISIIRHDYIISIIVKKIKIKKSNFFYKQKKLNMSKVIDKKNLVISKLNSYINKFTKKKVIIWGAGHQSLTLISLANISKKILFVVDSAIFKQNKFTPASHIPIVAPSKIHSSDIEAVIVMAASYSNEVVKILRKDYKYNFSIAVFKENNLVILR